MGEAGKTRTHNSPDQPKTITEPPNRSCRNLELLNRFEKISLHGVWIPDAYGSRTYRYLHYTAFGRDRMKLLEGDIENTYDSCLGCFFGCSSKQTEVNVTSKDGHHIFSIHLTGKLSKQPMDAAEIKAPDDSVLATVQWRSPCFEVFDAEGVPLLTLKRNRFNLCTLEKHEYIICPNSREPLGTVVFSYNITGPTWSDGYVLTTEIPRHLDILRRVAWVALMFLLKLCHRGREYAKILRVD